MKEEDLRALLSEQRSLANEYHTSIWRSSHFFAALIFSIFGILVLYRGSRYYLQATYAISVLRNKLDIQSSLKKKDLKAFGIDDLLCDRFSSAEEYVKKRSINLKQFRIRTIIYWIYIVLAIMSLLFMGYVFCS